MGNFGSTMHFRFKTASFFVQANFSLFLYKHCLLYQFKLCPLPIFTASSFQLSNACSFLFLYCTLDTICFCIVFHYHVSTSRFLGFRPADGAGKLCVLNHHVQKTTKPNMTFHQLLLLVPLYAQTFQKSKASFFHRDLDQEHRVHQ